MTTNREPRLKPAQNPTDPHPTTGTDGEGVKAVSLFESRQERRKRAWDELSEIDRAVLLESVRQRRKAQKHRTTIDAAVYTMRINR